jgi:sortase A
MTRRRRRLVAVLAASGLALAAHGAWLPAKAALGQALLERAWLRTRGGEDAARPWPWADTWPVARLEVPASGESSIVLAGATGESLAWGPGHLAGSALPGAPGNSVVAGHRDTHFAFLRALAPGDALHVERRDGSVVAYRVLEGRVVHERDGAPLAESAGRRLTLVTCWPFDALRPGGPLRYVVTAEVERALPV